MPPIGSAVITAGIDLAAAPKNTGVAVLDGLRVRDLVVDATDTCIVELSTAASKIGIDCPLGWPALFVDFVGRQAAGRALPPVATIADRAQLAYRVTDLYVAREHPPLRPLSVSADRIAHAAFRCAGLLPSLDPALDRSGHGRVVETYPAGSLYTWGMEYRRYKGRDGRPLREQIVRRLGTVVDFGDNAGLCIDSDHALDAVMAALTARAAAAGRATLPAPADLAAARLEGWITLPTCELADLTDPLR